MKTGLSVSGLFPSQPPIHRLHPIIPFIGPRTVRRTFRPTGSVSLPSAVNCAVVLGEDDAASDAFCAARTLLFFMLVTYPDIATAVTTAAKITKRRSDGPGEPVRPDQS